MAAVETMMKLIVIIFIFVDVSLKMSPPLKCGLMSQVGSKIKFFVF